MDASKVALARRTGDVMQGKWGPDVFLRLSGTSPMSYGAFDEEIPGIVGSMLTRTLQRMERDGLVRRIVWPNVDEVFAIEPTDDAADGVLVSLWVAQQNAPSVAGAVAADRVSLVPVADR